MTTQDIIDRANDDELPVATRIECLDCVLASNLDEFDRQHWEWVHQLMRKAESERHGQFVVARGGCYIRQFVDKVEPGACDFEQIGLLERADSFDLEAAVAVAHAVFVHDRGGNGIDIRPATGGERVNVFSWKR